MANPGSPAADSGGRRMALLADPGRPRFRPAVRRARKTCKGRSSQSTPHALPAQMRAINTASWSPISAATVGYVLPTAPAGTTPQGWGWRPAEPLDDFAADRVVVEKNYGDEKVQFTMDAVRRTAPLVLVKWAEPFSRTKNRAASGMSPRTWPTTRCPTSRPRCATRPCPAMSAKRLAQPAGRGVLGADRSLRGRGRRPCGLPRARAVQPGQLCRRRAPGGPIQRRF